MEKLVTKSHNEREANRIKHTKNVAIKLDRMSEKEYKMYSSTNEVIVKNVSIKISGDTAEINKGKHHSNNRPFNCKFKEQLSDYLECCDLWNVATSYITDTKYENESQK